MNVIVLKENVHVALNVESMRKLHLYAVEFSGNPGMYNVIKNKITGETGAHSSDELLSILEAASNY